jgi:hypothetical protein
LLGHRKEIAKFLMRTFSSRSTFLCGKILRRAGTVVRMQKLKISYQYPMSRSIILFTHRDHSGFEDPGLLEDLRLCLLGED